MHPLWGALVSRGIGHIADRLALAKVNRAQRARVVIAHGGTPSRRDRRLVAKLDQGHADRAAAQAASMERFVLDDLGELMPWQREILGAWVRQTIDGARAEHTAYQLRGTGRPGYDGDPTPDSDQG